MHYRDLIQETEIIEIKNGGIDVDVSDVVYDSRTAVPGSLFVAIFGFATDGHRFIEDAVKRGAKVIVHQAELDHYHDDVVYIKVTDCRAVFRSSHRKTHSLRHYRHQWQNQHHLFFKSRAARGE